MLFIAEIGMNHNGNFSLIYELVRQAKWAGADIAKLQLGWRDGEGDLNRLTDEWIDRFIRWCEYFGIEPLVSVFTRSAWERAKPRPFRRFKIASRTVRDDLDLVRDIVEDGRETIISLGMWEGREVPIPRRSNVRYLWCKARYPAEPWELRDLPKDFENSPYDGYSDHSIGLEVPLLAIARGARIIEKHFTLDKSDTTIRDHALSATPEEFADLVDLGRAMRRAMDVGV